MEPYYFHGFRNCNLDTLFKVLECGFILPQKDIKTTFTTRTNLYNGDAWISLCQKSLIDDTICDETNTSYSDIIFNNLCVVISPSLKNVVDTIYIPSDFFYDSTRKQLVRDDSKVRYSTFIDEVQTKEPISIKEFLAVGYPLAKFKKDISKKERDLNEIKRKLLEVGLDIPILDSSIPNFADSKEHFALSKIIK